MKNKGFTLIELIGVLVIMALLLLVVFPATMKLMKDNDQEKFDHYYDMILDAAEMYANNIRDDLGGVSASGCVDEILLTDLIEKKLVKTYDDEEVTCGSPSEFTLADYDIDDTKDYVDVRVRNTKGKITSEASLVCIKGKRVVYSKLIEKKETDKCDKYIAEASNVLINDVLKLSATTDDNINYYISGTVENNHVWYSGKLWRIVGYNKNDRTIKLVTNESISIVSYDMLYSNYSESNIFLWLNNEFLPTLRNNETTLVNTDWNFTKVTDASMPANTNINTSRVGMLNYYEYNKVQGFLNNTSNWWLLSRYSDTNSWYVGVSGGVSNANVATFYGVRPSVVLRPNITYISGGDGTVSNPYKLTGDNGANPSTLLNTRYSGEYVAFGGLKYRIVKTTPEYTRLILATNLTSVGNTIFDNLYRYHYNLDAVIGNLLNTTWYNELSENDRNKLYSGDFCTMILTPGISQTTECNPSDIYYYKIGIPKIGDMFTAGTSSGEYWTLSNSAEKTLNVISPNGIVSSKTIGELSGVRPVINIASGVKISGGNGTNNSPYTLE